MFNFKLFLSRTGNFAFSCILSTSILLEQPSFAMFEPLSEPRPESTATVVKPSKNKKTKAIRVETETPPSSEGEASSKAEEAVKQLAPIQGQGSSSRFKTVGPVGGSSRGESNKKSPSKNPLPPNSSKNSSSNIPDSGRVSKKQDTRVPPQKIEIEETFEDNADEEEENYAASKSDKYTKLKQKVKRGLFNLAPFNFNFELDPNIEKSATVNRLSVVLPNREQKKAFNTFTELQEQERTDPDASDYDKKVTAEMRALFDPNVHEVIINPRRTTRTRTLDPAFSLVFLDKTLTRKPLLEFKKEEENPTGKFSGDVVTAAADIVKEKNGEIVGPLKNFISLLKSKREAQNYSYNQLSTNVTFYREMRREWLKNPENFTGASTDSSTPYTGFIGAFDVLTNGAFDEEKLNVLFSYKKYQEVKKLSTQLGKMILPLSVSVIDYSIDLKVKGSTDTKFRVENKHIQCQPRGIGVWKDADSTELAHLVERNMRKKVAKRELGSTSQLAYELPVEDEDLFSGSKSKKNKGRSTYPVKWRSSRSDREMLVLLVNLTTANNSNSLPGVGGYTNKKANEDRMNVFVGVQLFWNLNSTIKKPSTASGVGPSTPLE